MEQEYQWMVCTRCWTYNHAPYITDALNGFTMQETTFPYVCVIVDDASTDGEQEVIKKYLQEHFDLEDTSIVRNEETEDYTLTFARHKTNKNCHFAVLYLKYNHYSIKKSKAPYLKEWQDNSKYIAICEGDDYWIVPNKLQMQVDFLEKNDDFVICSHDYVRYFENLKEFKDKSENQDFFDKEMKHGASYYEFSLDCYFKHWFTQPLTCLYRNGDYLKFIPYNKYKFFRDDVFFYYILKEGKGALLTDIMGVYRINDTGVWSTKSPIAKHKDSIYNAYNMFVVERDERAIYKMKHLEINLVCSLLHPFCLEEVKKEIIGYYKMVPCKHFLRFVLSLFKEILFRLIRKTRK